MTDDDLPVLKNSFTEASDEQRRELQKHLKAVVKGFGGVWRGMCWAGNTRRSAGMSIRSESSLGVSFRESVRNGTPSVASEPTINPSCSPLKEEHQ